MLVLADCFRVDVLRTLLLYRWIVVVSMSYTQ